MSNKIEPKFCNICGKEYMPIRSDQRCCGSPECTRERQRISQREYRQRNYARVLENNRRTRKERQDRQKWKEDGATDTIVAIGYADRQRAATLKMVGKVKTEL